MTAMNVETGLDFFGARYFSGAQGRFTSPDEPLVDQYAEDPQSWNLYGYVRNNPLIYVDSNGREMECTQDEAGNIRCTVKKPKESLSTTPQPPPDMSWFAEILLRSLVTTAQVTQQTQHVLQPVLNWVSQPRNPWCLAGAVGAGASAGGLAGLAGGPGGFVTVPGGFLIGGLAAGGVGLSTCMSNGGPASGDGGSAGGAQDKKLSATEIKKLEQRTGESAHQIKTEALGTNKNIAQYDLYKDLHGNVFVKAKGGTGEAIPTGLKVN